MNIDPKHAETAIALEQAFKKILPPGYKVCAMIVDTSSGVPPYPMFVTRSIPKEMSKDIAGAYADGHASVTVHIVELDAANADKEGGVEIPFNPEA
jgi:hypothetical protein